MFFRKKAQATPAFNPQDLAQAFIQTATILYHDQVQPGGSANIAATLEFDESLRISSVTNFMVNELPKVPSTDAIEAINSQLAALAVPIEHRPQGLSITVIDGDISTSAKYDQ